jgi:hypothetical protein
VQRAAGHPDEPALALVTQPHQLPVRVGENAVEEDEFDVVQLQCVDVVRLQQLQAAV